MKHIYRTAVLAAAFTAANGIYSQAPAPATAPKTAPAQTAPAAKPEPEKKSGGPAFWKDPATGTVYANSQTKFSLSSGDTLSNVDYTEYKVNEGPFQKYHAPFNLSSEGPYTVIYRTVDKAGNREPDRVFNVTIDNLAPNVVVLPSMPLVVKDGKNYTAPGNSVSIRVQDDFSGVKSVKYSVNSETMNDYKGEVVRLTQPGSHAIRYFAEDNLGNRTATGNLTVEVDAEKPAVDIVPSQPLVTIGAVPFARRTTSFRVSANDAGSGVAQILIRIDGNQEWKTYTDTIRFDTEKDHTIEAKAVDAVGNESEVKTLKFSVDDTPPTTELTPVLN